MRVIKSESFSQEDSNTEDNKSNSNDKVENLLKLHIPDPFERVQKTTEFSFTFNIKGRSYSPIDRMFAFHDIFKEEGML